MLPCYLQDSYRLLIRFPWCTHLDHDTPEKDELVNSTILDKYHLFLITFLLYILQGNFIIETNVLPGRYCLLTEDLLRSMRWQKTIFLSLTVQLLQY